MTNQEIFNKVWQHFVVEGNPRSVEPEKRYCAYRGPNGSKCAFGLFIPDEKYDPEMERKSLRGSYFDSLLAELGLLNQKKLLMELQFAHDGGYDLSLMTGHLAGVAKAFNLSVPNSPDTSPINE
jgi:hypothetical protein